MIINTVKLSNFGCIEQFERSFGKGIFILAGENGNGKSTVFKAIVMALFDAYEGSLSDYVNWNADEFEIDIDFEHRGSRYNVSVKHNVKSKTAERKFTEATTGNVYTGQEAKDRLKAIFDQELIMASMLSLEQQIDVVTVKPSERREYLKRIYDLEFKNQQQAIADSLAGLAEQTTALSTELSILRNKKYDEKTVPELPMTEVEYAELQNSYAEKMQEVGKLKAAQDQYDEAVKTVASLLLEIDTLTRETKEYEVSVQEKEKVLESLPTESKSRTVLMNADLYSARLTIPRINADPAIDIFDEQLAKITIVRVPIFDQENYNTVQAELGAAKAKVKELEGISDICPTCGQKLPQDEATIEKRKADLVMYQDRVVTLTTKVGELQQEQERIKTLNDDNQKNKDLKIKLTHDRELAVQKRDSLIRETEASISSLETAIANESQNLERLVKSAESEIAVMRKMITEKTDVISKTQKRLDDAKKIMVHDIAQELKLATTTVAYMKTQIDSYQNVRTERETAIRQNEQTEKEKKIDGAEIIRLDDVLQEKAHEIADLETCVKVLKNEFPVYVISKIVKDLETSMNDFLRKTYGGRYTVKLEDKKNALRMVYGPKGMDAGMASGYEKSIFSLAWKWALSKVQNNRTLMMDEVDSAASQKNSTIFYQTVGDSLKLFDQILIVSHKEQTRELLENEYGAQVMTFTGGVVA